MLMRKKIAHHLTEAFAKLPAHLVTISACVLTAGVVIWAMAVFTEPTVSPNSSNQDFAKNILGANNSDNAFDSSSVVPNNNGSIVEITKGISNNSNGATALSAETAAGTYTSQTAAAYCRNLSAAAQYALDGSDTSTTYTDWRLGETNELMQFAGISGLTSANYIWTAAISPGSPYWISMRLSDGYWYNCSWSYTFYVRCVR